MVRTKIGSGRAFAQASRKLHAHNQRNQHGDRLPEHRRLGLDAAHSPSQHAQAVDHCCVTVGAYEGVGVG